MGGLGWDNEVMTTVEVYDPTTDATKKELAEYARLLALQVLISRRSTANLCRSKPSSGRPPTILTPRRLSC
jgi:hypothetical protein